MIELKDISKTYHSKATSVEALKNVNLNICKGDIFGIIGYSGAGKSTLVRCINLLERPDGGRVIINGEDVTTLPLKELRKRREKIGMIFQHFNLMKRRTVYSNVAYPLKGKGLSKKQIEEKVASLLELVGLKDKINSYPSELSGGQKQRVAIARALANDPEILLCDEATSALDPQTTKSILSLIKEINLKLNITIVVITHQMEVIKEICNKVVVMENGEVVEQGSLADIFVKPETSISKAFVASTLRFDKAEEIIENIRKEKNGGNNSIVKISFFGETTTEAFISKISIDFNVFASVIFGNIEYIQGIPYGNLIVNITGEQENIHKSLGYLKENNIGVEVYYHARVA